MSNLTLPLAKPHHNRQLFSDHYLDVILPRRADWSLLRERANACRREIAALFVAGLAGSNEAQTEERIVKPVLRVLGHLFEVQPALKVPGSSNRPDYLFYRDEVSLNANRGVTLTEAEVGGRAYAVGDAKQWDRPLDVTLTDRGRDPLSNKNPAYQIAFYMQHSGVEWGLLTNGRLWRLYHRETAHKLDRYYEVDLQALVESEGEDDFLYFYLFFRREAFLDQAAGLAAILRASEAFAASLGDSLKAQVFEALRHIAQGLLDYRRNGLQTDAAGLRAIYDSALIVLYRLLFILYAEDRNLLPAQEPGEYRDTYSLYAIKRAVARSLDGGRQLLPDSTRIWAQLHDLFGIIDLGSPPLRVATFNGGLFDPARHPLLERCSVGDARLERAIDRLTRVKGQFVDYRDLSPRHLGTIYEGLLEFHLVAGSDDPEFTIDLQNDRGERKATGSYYTPDFIVKYIVDETVGPLLDRAVEGLTEDAERIAAVLGVRVLDPAMGSGHFLVEATEAIARYLVDLGVAPPEAAPGQADLAYWKRRVVQSCIYGVDLNPLAVELAKLSLWLTTVAHDRPLSFLDHHLRPGNALVGERLSQVESMAQMPRGAGRRTSAGRRREQQESAGQISMMEDEGFRSSMTGAVQKMHRIELGPADEVAQVKEQEALYRELQSELALRYGRLADLLTATRFGVSFDTAGWPELAAFASGRIVALRPVLAESMRLAAEIAQQRRFFHWELQFPEVFFGADGQPLGEERAGFDAVIGNPPYIRQEQLQPFKPFLQAGFASFHGVADLYLYFYEQALKLTRQNGRMGFITSGTFARANFAGAFRRWLPTYASIETLIDFGENQPFDGAEMVRPSIVLMRRATPQPPFRSLFIAERVPASLPDAVREQGIDCAPEALLQSEWSFQPAGDTRLFAKLTALGRRLIDVVDGAMYYGVKTGLNEAFLIDRATRDRLVAQDPGSAAILKPMVRGEDLRPWYQEDEGRWLIVMPNGWTRRRFDAELSEQDAWARLTALHPGIAEHLRPFADAARKRSDKGQYWWELRPCDYYSAFEGPKIFWPDICKLPRYSYNGTGTYVNDKGSIVASGDYWLLGVLQSRAIWFAVSQMCVPLRLRAGLWQYQMKSQFISRLPIPDASEADREAIGALAEAITALARSRYALHQRVRGRIAGDLGAPGVALNQKLTAWYDLAFPDLRAEVKKVFRRDIPLAERDDWDAYLAQRRAEHQSDTAEIVRLETELNARVYALFDLSAEEIAAIEASVRFPYGEV